MTDESPKPASVWNAFIQLAVAALLLAPQASLAETPVQRGAYLVNGIANCGNCHSPQAPDGSPAGAALSGGTALLSPAFTANPPNITPDRATGIGGWTQDQVVNALRNGRTRAGALIREPMPIDAYRAMADTDARAIAAYLLSLPPVRHASPPSHYDGPARDWGAQVTHVPDPNRADLVGYGGYLVQMGHCMACHSTPGADHKPDFVHGLGAGGMTLSGVFGQRVAPNITPDLETGIGAWTDAEVTTALVRGVRPDGERLGSPMPVRYLATLRPDDVRAIVAYLRTIPPVHNKVNSRPAPSPDGRL